MSTPSLTRRLRSFALMAALTLLNTVIGWINLRVISQVEQTIPGAAPHDEYGRGS